MDRCTDKRIGDMLFAYELNLLSPEDEQRVELHLFDCPYCLQRAMNFADAAQTLRDDDEPREIVRRISAESEIDTSAVAGRRNWRNVFRTAAIAAAVIIVLLLRPWQFEFKPSHEAIAEGNRVAVMNFRNLAQSDDEVQWGQVISSLLISDLSETRNLQVISTQHLLDLARDDQDPSAPPNEERAIELAERAGARWLVEGDILQLEPSPVVVARVVDARSGTVKASERVEAQPDQSLYAVVDPLTVRIVSCVLQPSLRIGEPDRLITDITSSSPHALQYYLEGLAFRAQFYNNEAMQKFEKAVTADSTFAMAYYYLSRYQIEPERTRLIEKASRFSGKAGRRDSLLIASGVALAQGDNRRAEELLIQITKEYPQEKEAHYDLGKYYHGVRRLEDARRHFSEAIRIDSGYKVAYNSLAYVYADLRDSVKAMWAIDRYVATAPNEANVYDSRGDVLLRFEMVDEAITSYRRALATKPDFYASLRSLGDCLLHTRKYDGADSCYAALLAAPVQDAYTEEALWLTAMPALRQGDFEKAVSILETNSRRSRKDNPSLYYLHYLRALLLAELDRKAEARRAVDSAVAIAKSLDFNVSYAFVDRIYLLTRIGDLATARQDMARLKQHEITPDMIAIHLPLAQAYIEFALGNYGTSRQLLELVLGPTQNPQGRCYFTARSLYAVSCLHLGDLSSAADMFSALLRKPAAKRTFWSLLDIRNYYYLGLTFEKLGKTEAAVAWYDQFLLFWNQAPQPISEVQDAKARMDTLRYSKPRKSPA